MLLNKSGILSGSTRKTKDVKAFGGTVRLREMSGNMRDEYEIFLLSTRNKSEGEGEDDSRPKIVRATLLVYSIVDEKDNLIFSQSDIKALGDQPISGLQLLYDTAIKLNALSAEDLKTLEGNLKGTQKESSTMS